MHSSRKARMISNGKIYDVWQWNGQDFPPEGFEEFGYFEHDNGYDLDHCTQDFICDTNRTKNIVKLDDWVIKSEYGQFGICTPKWFQENMILEGEPRRLIKRTREEIEDMYKQCLQENLNKTRGIKYPSYVSDPMEKRIYFSTEVLMKSHEEALETILNAIYGEKK